MAELKVGDTFPEGVSFTYVPYLPENAGAAACGIPQKYDASEDFKDKKVVLIAVPGAFTPTCQVAHISSFTANIDKIKAKGVDKVIVIAFNDIWVMAAWGKANGVTDDSILFMSDAGLAFSKKIGWVGPTGERTLRYAFVVDHGKVVYAEKETKPGSIEVTGAEAILPKL